MFTADQELLSDIRYIINRQHITGFIHDYVNGYAVEEKTAEVRVLRGFTNIVSIVLDISGSELSENLNEAVQRINKLKTGQETDFLITQLVINVPTKRTMTSENSSDMTRKLVAYIDDDVMMTTGLIVTDKSGAGSFESISTGLMYKDIEHYMPQLLEGNVHLTVNGSVDLNLNGFELLESKFNTDAYATVFLRNTTTTINVDEDNNGYVIADFYVFDGESLEKLTHSVEFTTEGDKGIATLTPSDHNRNTDHLHHNDDVIVSMENIMFRIIRKKLTSLDIHKAITNQ